MAAAAGSGSATRKFTFSGPEDFNAAFAALKVADFPTPASGGVVVIPSDASVRDAVRTLVKHNILAAPVRDVTVTSSEASWAELYVGLVDMTDVVVAALNVVNDGKHLPTVEEGAGEAEAAAATGPGLSDMSSIVERAAWFTDTPVTEVMHTFKFSPFVPVDVTTSTMLDVMLILGKYGHHRVVAIQPTVDLAAAAATGTDGDTSEASAMKDLVREDKRLCNIITQSAVVGQIAANLAALHAVASKPLTELGLGETKDLVCVHIDHPVYDAFKALRDYSISAVPVVGEGGALVGTISNRDIRMVLGCGAAGEADEEATTSLVFSHMFTPIRSFMASLSRFRADLGHPSVAVTREDTLAHVVGRLVATRIHRVFVINKSRVPVGVISLRDVIGCFVHEPKDYFGKYFDDEVRA